MWEGLQIPWKRPSDIRSKNSSTAAPAGSTEISTPPRGEKMPPVKPADYYQSTKYEAEPIVNDFYKKGMKTVILRPAAIYGPGDPERFYMIFKRASAGTFPMFGSGRTFYHPLYIDNLIDAFMLAMEEDKGNGQAYLIPDEEYLEIGELVRKVGRAMGIEVKIKHYPIIPLMIAGHIFEKLCKPIKITPPIFPRRVDWYRQNRAFKIDKAKKELGYQPRVGIDEGLKRTAEWYKKEGYL
jgi:nucleoside-diphosphate-sugar epimerase